MSAQNQRLSRVVDAAAYGVERAAKRLAPVDTGRLRASILTGNRGKLLRVVSANTEYARHVEYGTKRMNAKPYMRPAAQLVRKNLAQIWKMTP